MIFQIPDRQFSIDGSLFTQWGIYMRYLCYLGIYIICTCPALGLSCAPGTYLSVAEQICQICPENYYCPGQENVEIYQSRYVTVPYIESDNYSYINTQIIPSLDKDFYFLADMPENPTQQVAFYWVRALQNVITYPTYGCIYNPEKPDFIRAYRNSSGAKTLPHTPINPLTSRTIEYQTDGPYFYINGTKYEFPDNHPDELVPYPIYLFKLNEENTGKYTDNYQMQSGIRMYRWRVTQNGNVLQDMVPAYDTTDQKYGMYDTITQKFFGNGNCRGTFIGTDIKKNCSTETHNIAPHSPTGSKNITDCGRILHIGNYKLYLTMQKRTSPSLAIQYGDNTFYGSMTTDIRDNLRTEYNGKIYSIFTPHID